MTIGFPQKQVKRKKNPVNILSWRLTCQANGSGSLQGVLMQLCHVHLSGRSDIGPGAIWYLHLQLIRAWRSSFSDTELTWALVQTEIPNRTVERFDQLRIFMAQSCLQESNNSVDLLRSSNRQTNTKDHLLEFLIWKYSLIYSLLLCREASWAGPVCVPKGRVTVYPLHTVATQRAQTNYPLQSWGQRERRKKTCSAA